MSSLDPDKAEKLSLFKEITSFPEEDESKIITLLNNSNWDLEIAIPRFFDGNYEPIEPIEPVSAASNNDFEPIEPTDGLHQRRQSFQDREMVNLQSQFLEERYLPRLPRASNITNQWRFHIGLATPVAPDSFNSNSPFLFILLIIPRTLLYLATSLFDLLSVFFPAFFTIIGYLKTESDFPARFDYQVYDENHNYKSLFESKETVDGIDITQKVHDKDYNQIYEDAKKTYGWLLMILVNDSSKSKTFVDELFTNRTFLRFLESNKISLYINDVTKSPEAYEIGKIHRIRNVPFIGLVGNVSNIPSVMPSMSFVFSKNLTTSTEKLAKKLKNLVDNFEPQLITQRMDLQEREFSRLIKQQQDEAYEMSLLQDKLKKEEKTKKEKQQLEKVSKQKLRERYLQFKIIHYYEKWNGYQVETSEKAEYSTIQFRLPDGTRFVQSFPKTLTTYDIYLFIQCKLYLENLQEEEEEKSYDEIISAIGQEIEHEEASAFDKFKLKFQFELFQNFPKLIIQSDDKTLHTVKEVYPRGNLLVEFEGGE